MSVSSSGAQSADGIINDVAMSDDGRYVAFVSTASNLVPGDTIASYDAFVRDRVLATTERVGGSAEVEISGNGRFVVFHGPVAGVNQELVRDLVTGSTTVASILPDGSRSTNSSSQVSISADGRFVAFVSSTPSQVYVRDLQLGQTVRASVSSDGTPGNQASSHPAVSDDGRLVAYNSGATTLVPADTNGVGDVFVHDTVTGETTRISVSSAGSQSNNVINHDGLPSISADGRYVTFTSAANNLVAGDTNGSVDVFLHDRVTHETSRLSVSSTGTQANSFSAEPQISADGSHVAFSSHATNLVAGDTNARDDIFVRQVAAMDDTPPEVSYALTPSPPDGDNGWYMSPLTLTYGCTDATSGVVSCPPDSTLGEGAGQVVQAIGSDQAGNTRTVSSGPFDVDLSDPVVTCQSAPAFLLGQTGHVSATVADAVSGAAAPIVTGEADTASVGSAAATVTGADIAGRTATASCGYQVRYGFTGFQAPVDNGVVNVAKAGTAIPLKWRLTDYSGNLVLDLTSVRITSASHTCDGGAPEDAIQEVASGASGLQNLGDGNYQLNWKSPKTYAGTCRTLQLDLGEGQLSTAEFRFKA